MWTQHTISHQKNKRDTLQLKPVAKEVLYTHKLACKVLYQHVKSWSKNSTSMWKVQIRKSYAHTLQNIWVFFDGN